MVIAQRFVVGGETAFVAAHGRGHSTLAAALRAEAAAFVLRGPPRCGKSWELGRLPSSRRLDAARLGHALQHCPARVEALVDQLRGRGYRWLAVDGLERTETAALGPWAAELAPRLSPTQLIVSHRSGLPPPFPGLQDLVMTSIGVAPPPRLSPKAARSDLAALAAESVLSRSGCLSSRLGPDGRRQVFTDLSTRNRLAALWFLRRWDAWGEPVPWPEHFCGYVSDAQDFFAVARSVTWLTIARQILAVPVRARQALVADLAARCPVLLAAAGGERLRSRTSRARHGEQHPMESAIWSEWTGKAPRNTAGEGLASTPVTQGQFMRFVRDGGYRTRAHWSEQGLSWLRGESSPDLFLHWRGYLSWLRAQGLAAMARQRQWRPERYALLRYLANLNETELRSAVRALSERRYDGPAETHRELFTRPLHPVVGVNFHESMAFATWVSRRTGRDVRLPSAAEWESAIPAGQAFPWGDEPQQNLANTAESGFGATTAVGTYPPDQRGRFDLSGNVWEWTTTRVAGDSLPPGSGFPGVTYRVVKGGSWDNPGDRANCAVRDFDPEEIWGSRLGFRLYWA